MAAKLLDYLVGQSANPTGVIGRRMMRIWNRAYLPMVAWGLGLLPQGLAPGEILDIGMGNGATSDMLGRRFPQSRVLGIDISATAVAAAKKRYPAHSFGLGDAHNLALGAGRFGLVCGFQTHFHWQDLPLAFREVRRAVTPGGYFLLAFETEKQRLFLPEYSTAESVAALGCEAGFKSTETARQGAWAAWIFQA